MHSILRIPNFWLVIIVIIGFSIASYTTGLLNNIAIIIAGGALAYLFWELLTKLYHFWGKRKIKSFPDYKKSVEAIEKYLRELVKKEKKCDIAILYVRDELYPDEYNLVTQFGIGDLSPMFGPLVYNDYRIKKVDEALPEVFENITGNQTEFQLRESVRALAKFKLEELNNQNKSKAVLYLNWRNEQSFTDEEKKEILMCKEQIFNAVKKLKGESNEWRRWNNKELWARRWIDVHLHEYRNLLNLFIKTIDLFLDHINENDLSIIIATKVKSTINYFGRKLNTSMINEIEHSFIDESIIKELNWVIKTTRPKFLFTLGQETTTLNARKIIIPIRLSTKKDRCKSAIYIQCSTNILTPEMVKPLCFLADHFGCIEESTKINNSV
ncbi:MAG: hypothetical protein DWQ05_08025 [Calditrichaeota bacterium]|nr:MAG: hypothetical protein DWQ05_08025 [Calditrichota bacterium]